MGSHTAVRCICGLLGAAALGISTAGAARLEFGTVTVQDTFTTPSATRVTFIEPFEVTPVVVSLPTTQGGDPATLRIFNVSRLGFDVVQVEPNSNDGPHVAMDTAYLAVEPGNHTLPGGQRLVAFTRDTTQTVSGITGQNWASATLTAGFTTAPAIVAAIQTRRNESGTPPATSSIPFVAVAMRAVQASGFDFALERAESTAGTVTSTETIGFVATDAFAAVTLADTSGNTATLAALVTANNIEGFSNGCFTNSFAQSFAATPLAVASMNTRNGGNGGWLRRCSIGAGSIGLTVDEDIDNDSERNHIDETAAVIAASRAFHANLGVGLSLAKTVTVTSDPVGTGAEPFAIPGAVVAYDLTVQNLGASAPDSGTLTITDEIPAELSLCVATSCQSGGPVLLDDSGSPVATGLGVGSVAYSNDSAATFGYTPSPDAAGFDAAVTHIRIALTGTLPGLGASGSPSVTLRLAARVN